MSFYLAPNPFPNATMTTCIQFIDMKFFINIILTAVDTRNEKKYYSLAALNSFNYQNKFPFSMNNFMQLTSHQKFKTFCIPLIKIQMEIWYANQEREKKNGYRFYITELQMGRVFFCEIINSLPTILNIFSNHSFRAANFHGTHRGLEKKKNLQANPFLCWKRVAQGF